MRVMVQRSPFLTQSVAVSRSRRSFARVMITSPAQACFPSASRTAAIRNVAGEAMGAGAPVELGDKLTGGGDHDRVEPSRSIGNPSVKGILGGLGEVADLDTSVIEVEGERGRIGFAEGE